jgi:hypothetical protein
VGFRGGAAAGGSHLVRSPRPIRGNNTLGDLVMYYQTFQRVQGSLQGMLGTLAGLYSDSLFLSNLYEFLDLKRTLAEPVVARPVPRPMQRGGRGPMTSFAGCPRATTRCWGNGSRTGRN